MTPEDQALGRAIVERVLGFTRVSREAFHKAHRAASHVSHARALAIYLACAEFGLNQPQAAAVVGLTKQAVSLNLPKIEDLRDDRALEAAIEVMVEELRRRFPPAPANDNQVAS